jgi:hypothetical protein
MKNTFALVFLGIILLYSLVSSCSGNKRDAQGREDFKIFIEKFYKDKDFQLSRIDFPITGKIQEDGRVQIIEEENWEILKPLDPKSADYAIQIREISSDLIEQRIVVKQSFLIQLQFSLNPVSNDWYLSAYSGISGVAANAEVDPLLQDSSRTVRFVHPDSLKNEQ